MANKNKKTVGKNSIGYDPKYDIEEELFDNIKLNEPDEKYIIINLECSSCNYNNKLGILKGKESVKCPMCKTEIELVWDEEN